MQQAPYETWANDFRFTEDLKLLEHVYQQEHQDDLRRQQSPKKGRKTNNGQKESRQPAGQQPATSDNIFLEQISEKIAQRLGDYLSDTDLLAFYAKLDELETDNAKMATQIQQLLEELAMLRHENLRLTQENMTYRPLIGPLYYKVL